MDATLRQVAAEYAEAVRRKQQASVGSPEYQMYQAQAQTTQQLYLELSRLARETARVARNPIMRSHASLTFNAPPAPLPLTRIPITAHSWLLVGELPAELHRGVELMDLCPAVRGTVKMWGKEIDVPRYQEAFLEAYRFSGIDHPPTRDPPEIVLALQAYLQSLRLTYPDSTVFEATACLANWYKSGTDYIGAHSDDESQMHEVAGETFVACVSYCGARKLRIRNVRTKMILLDRVIEPNTVYVMAGKFQKELTHEFPKTAKPVDPRVSFTFRHFAASKRKR